MDIMEYTLLQRKCVPIGESVESGIRDGFLCSRVQIWSPMQKRASETRFVSSNPENVATVGN
jgi:hypothetical protein